MKPSTSAAQSHSADKKYSGFSIQVGTGKSNWWLEFADGSQEHAVLDGKERRRLLGKERGLLEEIELIRKWAKA